MPDGGVVREPVAAHFSGLARAFLKRVETAANVSKQIQSDCVEFCAKLVHGPRRVSYRAEDFAAVEAAWRSLPQMSLLTPLVVERRGHRLKMTTTQISRILSRCVTWADGLDEPNLMVVRHVFEATKRRTTYDSVPQMSISAHALARNYQRRIGPSDDDAVKADIAALVRHRVTAIPSLEIEVPVPGGRWRGRYGVMRVLNGDKYCVLEVRTFLS